MTGKAPDDNVAWRMREIEARETYRGGTEIASRRGAVGVCDGSANRSADTTATPKGTATARVIVHRCAFPPTVNQARIGASPAQAGNTRRIVTKIGYTAAARDAKELHAAHDTVAITDAETYLP
jgi:hypothetical protein